jgi:hypothetical protein
MTRQLVKERHTSIDKINDLRMMSAVDSSCLYQRVSGERIEPFPEIGFIGRLIKKNEGRFHAAVLPARRFWIKPSAFPTAVLNGSGAVRPRHLEHRCVTERGLGLLHSPISERVAGKCGA